MHGTSCLQAQDAHFGELGAVAAGDLGDAVLPIIGEFQ